MKLPVALPPTDVTRGITRDLARPGPADADREAARMRHLAAATLGLGTLYERRGDAFIRLPVHRRQHGPAVEWHARHEAGRLVHLTFTFETLEEWSALAAASPRETVGLYRDLLGRPDLREADLHWRADVFARGEEGHVLAFPAGAYNPFNAWNTVRGAIHLTHPVRGAHGGITPPEAGLLFLGAADVTADLLHPRRRDDRTGRVTRLEVEPPRGAFYDLEDLSLPDGEPLTPLGLGRHLAPFTIGVPGGASGLGDEDGPRTTLPGTLVAGAMLRRGAVAHVGRA